MSPTGSNAEIIKNIQELQQRMARVEVEQDKLETDLSRLQQVTDEGQDDVRASYATKTELNLQLENLRLTIENLKMGITTLTGRMEGLETNIVKKVEDIGKKQQDEQVASMRRLIALQGGILFAVLAAVLGVIVPIILHH